MSIHLPDMEKAGHDHASHIILKITESNATAAVNDEPIYDIDESSNFAVSGNEGNEFNPDSILPIFQDKQETITLIDEIKVLDALEFFYLG